MPRVQTSRASEARAERSFAVGGLQAAAGLLAGVAALIFVTGGAALGLRLLWSGLPALPVGQMPRDFLFSLGAAQVVLPALAFGLIAGLIELGEHPSRVQDGHQTWSYAAVRRPLRRTYLGFRAAIPFVLISPAIAIALFNDDDLDHQTSGLIAVGVMASAALVIWIGQVRSTRLVRRRKETDKEPLGVKLRLREWVAMLASVYASIVLAVWLWWFDADAARYFGMVAAVAVAFLFALLVGWLRGLIGEHSRKHGTVEPRHVILSWCATALLAVPALIAITAAWPLTEAVVCSEQVNKQPYAAAGLFVGDTKDRIYIGDDKARRIISVPTSKVSRMIVGRDSRDVEACGPRTDPRPANKSS
jgi:hypothetical protein